MAKLPYDIRVEIPVYTTAWLQGARRGRVVKIIWGKGKGSRAGVIPKRNNINGNDERQIAWVQLDKTKAVIKVIYADCEVLA